MNEDGPMGGWPNFALVIHRASSAALDVEIVQEKAASLGRLGRHLEAALAALRSFDAERAGTSAAAHDAEREALVTEAGTVLWHFIVQREACGLRDSARVFEHYRVPNEVCGRMGMFPGRTTPGNRQRMKHPRRTAETR